MKTYLQILDTIADLAWPENLIVCQEDYATLYNLVEPDLRRSDAKGAYIRLGTTKIRQKNVYVLDVSDRRVFE